MRPSAPVAAPDQACGRTPRRQVLGVVFEAPSDRAAPTLPVTGSSPRTLLIGGATLLCAGSWLLLLSCRRSHRGAHR